MHGISAPVVTQLAEWAEERDNHLIFLVKKKGYVNTKL
jgi:hypothetical protein